MKLRMAPATDRFVRNFSRNTPHALLLTGPDGIGLFTLAHHIAQANGRILAVVTPESKTSALRSISVERIRELYVQTKSRLDGTNFVIIDDADTMNHVAQNALLKLLEEPNPSIRFILTSHIPDKLLPTIRSRTQHFAVPRITTLESKRLLSANAELDEVTIQRLLFVADGLPAQLARLSHDSSGFKKLSERVLTARQIVEGTPYQRLALVASLDSDRGDAIALIEMVILLLRRSLATRPEQSTVRLVERMVEASEAIRANGSVKLHLSVAMV